jgi:hypothetical protein
MSPTRMFALVRNSGLGFLRASEFGAEALAK